MANTSLITEGVALDLGGQITYKKFTLTWDYIKSLTGSAGSLTCTVPLVTIPRGGFVLFCMIHPTIQFAGATTVKASVGNAGSATAFAAQSADMVAPAIADTAITVGPSAATPGSSMAATVCNAYLTSTVANLDQLTAGSFDIFLAFANPSTPSL